MRANDVYINGKQRRAVIIRGREYVRKGYDLPVEVAERFCKKCDMLGEDESKIIEKLATAFTEVNGWGEQVKQAPVFEQRAGYHVADAAKKTIRGLFPWKISQN
jgi:hypothetical protein